MFQKINDFFSSKKNKKLINEISGKYLLKVNNNENEIQNLTKEEINSSLDKLKSKYLSLPRNSVKKCTTPASVSLGQSEMSKYSRALHFEPIRDSAISSNFGLSLKSM